MPGGNTPEKKNLRCIQITNSRSFTGNYTEPTRIQMRYKSLPVGQCKQHRMGCWKPKCKLMKVRTATENMHARRPQLQHLLSDLR